MLTRNKKLGMATGIAVIVGASWFVPIYGNICSKDAYTDHKDCPTYHIPTVILWQVGEFLNYYGGAITAIATAFIGYFTYTLYRTSYKQARLTRESIDLARDEFGATHRPKLIIHSIEFRFVPHEGDDGLDRIGASILCFSRGETAAKNVEARGEILPTFNLGIDVQRPLVKAYPEVSSGQKLRIEIESDWRIRDLIERDQWAAPFYCIGTIIYLDQNETTREIGFCFQLKGNRWISAENPEHEYDY